ncbi:MAG: Mur ligase domain-containing protein, partial [Dehalococcoidia bacterium]
MIEHADVLAGLGEGLLAVTGTAAPAYRRAVADSRLVRPGDLFVALRGERVDGNDFVAEALARGAAGALVERA